MRDLGRLVSGAIVALGAGCASDAYDAPGPDTEPAVSVSYPHYYLDQVDPTLEPVQFGTASADLSVTIVGMEKNGKDRTIDFGLPREAVMHGYGAFEGMTERYHRTRLVDARGVHGVRVAVYRTDSARGHTNVWSHFLARSRDADVFLTEQAQWDWIGGDADTAGFSKGAWPFFQEILLSHYFYDSFFGFSPGVYSRTDYIRKVVLSTVATSPTYRIEDCTQVLFNATDPALRHQAFLSERYGLVEVVYRWHDLDSKTGDDYPIVPLDGFAAPEESFQALPEPLSTSNELAGTWRASVGFEDEQGRSTPRAVTLTLTAQGMNYRPLSDSYDVEGTYSDDEVTSIHMRGRYHRGSKILKLVAGRTTDLIDVQGVFSPGDRAGRIRASFFRYVNDSELAGTGELALVPSKP